MRDTSRFLAPLLAEAVDLKGVTSVGELRVVQADTQSGLGHKAAQVDRAVVLASGTRKDGLDRDVVRLFLLPFATGRSLNVVSKRGRHVALQADHRVVSDCAGQQGERRSAHERVAPAGATSLRSHEIACPCVIVRLKTVAEYRTESIAILNS